MPKRWSPTPTRSAAASRSAGATCSPAAPTPSSTCASPKAVLPTARAHASRLKARGADLVAGGTDTHLALVDLRPLGITGKDADEGAPGGGRPLNKKRGPVET